MKKIISILSVAFIAFSTGCEETATLDGGVDQRITAVINKYIETLSGAENGWFTDVMTNKGNYRFYMDFTADNYVTMYTDNLAYKDEYYTKSERSTYNIRSLERPVLSFDTYTLIHLINDPDDEISGGTDNKGLETDFEFEIDSLGKDGIFYMTGRINRVVATVRPATAVEAARVKEGAMMDVLDLAGNYLPEKYKSFNVGNTPVVAYFGQRISFFTYTENEQPVLHKSYIRTRIDGGIELIDPVIIEGKKITAVDFDAASNVYSAVIDGTLVPIVAGTEPAVQLPDIFGPWKQYRYFAGELSLYDSTDRKDNEFGYAYKMDDQAIRDNINIGGERVYLRQILAQITETDLGQLRLKLTLVVCFLGTTSGLNTSYSFPIAYTNDEMDEFTVGALKLDDGNASTIYNVGAKNVANLFAGKTFRIEMATDIYQNSLLGQFRMVSGGGSNPAYFLGLLSE